MPPLPRRVVAPEDVLPALPLFLGYRPTDSLVCLFFDHDRMVLSSRVDWATCQVAPGEVVETLAARAGNCGASAVFIIQRWKPGVRTGRPSPTCRCTSWWRGWRCCGRDGPPAAPGAGWNVFRNVHEHLLDPHSPAVQLIGGMVGSPRPRRVLPAGGTPRSSAGPGITIAPGSQREQWRDQAIHDPSQLLQSDRPGCGGRVAHRPGFYDIRTRDVVLGDWKCTDEGRAVSGSAFAGVRHQCCVRPHRQHRAGRGRGGADRLAVGRGNARHRLSASGRSRRSGPLPGILVRTSVQQAVPPTVWRQCMSSDEETCRHGTHTTTTTSTR